MTELNIDKIYEGVRKSLKDFSPPIDTNKNIIYSEKSSKFHIEREEIPVPELIQFTLSNILHCPTFGPGEKMRWEIPFRYKNFECTFALQKFGLRLYISNSDEALKDAIKIEKEILGKLKRVISKIEKKLLTPFAKHQICKRNVTIANYFHKLENRYVYFREKAEKISTAKLNKDVKHDVDIFGGLNDLFKARSELFYNTIAMLDAYFSFLEHLFVLLLPFAEKQNHNIDLVQFVSSFWSDKFKKLFDIETDTQAKKIYDELNEIKEHYRNFYAHGGFKKRGASFYIHFPGLGAIPAQLTNIKNNPQFKFFPVGEDNFSDICKIIDQFNDWLRSDHSGVKYAVKYAESGLDIQCDHENIRKIKDSMGSEEEFESLLNQYSYIADMHANMDY